MRPSRKREPSKIKVGMTMDFFCRDIGTRKISCATKWLWSVTNSSLVRHALVLDVPKTLVTLPTSSCARVEIRNPNETPSPPLFGPNTRVVKGPLPWCSKLTIDERHDPLCSKAGSIFHVSDAASVGPEIIVRTGIRLELKIRYFLRDILRRSSP